MNDNTIILIIAEISLAALGLMALVHGEKDIAEIATGAFIGLVAGHLNGRQGVPSAPP